MAELKTWGWITSKYPNANFSYSEWCLSPMACLKYL